MKKTLTFFNIVNHTGFPQADPSRSNGRSPHRTYAQHSHTDHQARPGTPCHYKATYYSRMVK